MPEGLPDISNERIVIYAAIALVLLLAVATATEKGLGPISRWWFDFARRRREASAAARAGDYEGLSRQMRNLNAQVEYLTREQARTRLELEERDRLAFAHVVWDREARRVLGEHGITLPEPPPLWPAGPTTSAPPPPSPSGGTPV